MLSLGRKPVVVAVEVLGYVAITYWLYSGPLSTIAANLHHLIWNYGVVFVLIGVTWATTRFLPTRELPKMKASTLQFVILLSSLTAYLLLIVYLWTSLARHPWPWFVRLAHLIQTDRHLSPLAQSTVISAVFAVLVTFFAVAMGVWQLWRWRRTVWSLTWKQAGVTVLLILVVTVLASFIHGLFGVRSSLFPTGGWLSILVAFTSQMFVNGLPEETFFRGYVFSQSLVFLKSPLLACWLMVALFDASHIPSWMIGQGLHLQWWRFALECLFPFQPTGWLFGAIYYRTKSILPGALLHTYITNWGFPFIS